MTKGKQIKRTQLIRYLPMVVIRNDYAEMYLHAFDDDDVARFKEKHGAEPLGDWQTVEVGCD